MRNSWKKTLQFRTVEEPNPISSKKPEPNLIYVPSQKAGPSLTNIKPSLCAKEHINGPCQWPTQPLSFMVSSLNRNQASEHSKSSYPGDDRWDELSRKQHFHLSQLSPSSISALQVLQLPATSPMLCFDCTQHSDHNWTRCFLYKKSLAKLSSHRDFLERFWFLVVFFPLVHYPKSRSFSPDTENVISTSPTRICFVSNLQLGHITDWQHSNITSNTELIACHLHNSYQNLPGCAARIPCQSSLPTQRIEWLEGITWIGVHPNWCEGKYRRKGALLQVADWALENHESFENGILKYTCMFKK